MDIALTKLYTEIYSVVVIILHSPRIYRREGLHKDSTGLLHDQRAILAAKGSVVTIPLRGDDAVIKHRKNLFAMLN